MVNSAEEEATCLVCGFYHEESEEPSPRLILLRTILTAVSGSLLLLSFLMILFLGASDLTRLLLTVAIVSGGVFIAARGIKDLLRPSFSIEFLMIVAAVGAYIIGELLEAGAIVFLFSIAELLEERSGKRVKGSLRELMELAPRTASVRRDGSEISLPVEEVKIGDLVFIKSGERIPMDGVVVSGEAAVDQASITGESAPAFKEEGDTVFAGTILEEGYLEVQVTKLSKDNTLARIIHQVESVDAKKARSQRFVEKFSTYYTPLVVLLAAIIILIPPLLFQADWRAWTYRGLVLLLISCPCALVISTPVSVVSAVSGAAKKGVLIKGGMYLEALAQVDTVVLDKTGTLTTGDLQVTEVEAFGSSSEEEVLRIAASLESRSEHRLGEAIVSRAEQEGIELESVGGFRSYPGRGVQGALQGKTYYLGNARHMEEFGLHPRPLQVDAGEADGGTIVYLWDEESILGAIVLSDLVREEARDAVTALKEMGAAVAVLTGDNWSAARRVAKEIGVDEVYAELLPEEKVAAIQRLQREGRKVAMVGDGVNDAPALAAADVGIAMGAAGTDIAIDTADVALMGDQLSKIPYVLRLARKSVGIIKENSFSSVAIKLSLLVLAIPGIATLWMAVLLGDMGASVGVIANALRLART
ncbi:MAG: heavy metal translocating P-type ATPase [Thermoplasmata archaeon]